MLKTFAVAGIASLSLFSAACSSSSPVQPTSLTAAPSSADECTPRSSEPTITAIAAGNPDFSTLVYALGEAGLVAEFDGRPDDTVFAPTNAAFEAAAQAFGQANGTALIDFLKGAGLLDDVLTCHVTRGSRDPTSVSSSGQVLMLDGNTAAVSVDGGVAKIDAVLLPPALPQ